MKMLKEKAGKLLWEFKGKDYVFGPGCLGRAGEQAASLGKKVLLITRLHQRDPASYETLASSLEEQGLAVKGPIPSARPNSPKEDVSRIKEAILRFEPEALVVASGGSGIDAAKAALVLAVLGGDVEDYFGTGKVTEELERRGKKLLSLLAIQTASSSAAHLTKYANITDLRARQKKLIMDEAVVPRKALFDYSLTRSMSASFTLDGAFDGLSHCLEVYYGARGEAFGKIKETALTGIELILAYLEKAVTSMQDMEAREGLGLATDLGGYAIMLGGTSGAHLNSFSFVDVLSHGRACGLLNPYYTVFFAPAIKEKLGRLSRLFAKYGLVPEASLNLEGKELGVAVARGFLNLSRAVGFPVTLAEIEGMTMRHIEKALQAARDPALEMKLQNMPVPMTPDMVDEWMRPVLEAAWSGDFSLIRTI